MLHRRLMHEKTNGELGLEETVDAAGMDSFPASDPPSWAPTHVGTPWSVHGPELFHRVVQRLHDDVRLLSETIGERNSRSPRAEANLERAAQAIEERFRDAGLPVKRRRGECIEAVIQGDTHASDSIVVGAHYDTLQGSPGADDDASGIATLIALARTLADSKLGRTVRLVAFGREEPPYTGAPTMSSGMYASDLARQGSTVTAMLSLEGIGRGDLAMVGSPRKLALRMQRVFEASSAAVKVAVPRLKVLFRAVRVASHLSFAERGIPAVLVTDRVLLWSGRDSCEWLDYEKLGHTTVGLAGVVRDLAGR